MPTLTLAAVLGGAGLALVSSVYLAGLTVSVPDRANTHWWHPRVPGRARWASTTAIAVVLAALGSAAADWTSAWPAYLGLALAGSVLVVVDVEHHRLPDRMILSAATAVAVVFFLVAALDGYWTALGRAAAAAAVVFALLGAVVLIFPRGLGFGDAKLAGLMAGCLAWRSWRAVLDGLALGILAAGVFAVVLLVVSRAHARTHIPLGPFLLAGALVITALPR